MEFNTWRKAYLLEVKRSGLDRLEPHSVQVAELARALGADLREELIVTGFDFNNVDELETLSVDRILALVDEHFAKEEDPLAAEVNMLARRQEEVERVAAFASALRQLVKTTS